MWFQSEKSEDAEAFKPRVLSITMMEGGSDGGAVDGAGVDVGTISPRLPPTLPVTAVATLRHLQKVHLRFNFCSSLTATSVLAVFVFKHNVILVKRFTTLEKNLPGSALLMYFRFHQVNFLVKRDQKTHRLTTWPSQQYVVYGRRLDLNFEISV